MAVLIEELPLQLGKLTLATGKAFVAPAFPSRPPPFRASPLVFSTLTVLPQPLKLE